MYKVKGLSLVQSFWIILRIPFHVVVWIKKKVAFFVQKH